MAYGQTITAIGAALSSVASTAALAVPVGVRDDLTVVVAATAVTAGATLQLQGRNKGVPEGSPGFTVGPWFPLGDPVTITANGATVVPLKKVAESKLPEEIRVTVTARTDGTYTSTLVRTP